MIRLSGILHAEALQALHAELKEAEFEDGLRTAPDEVRDRKKNLQFQLPLEDEKGLTRTILNGLASHPVLASWARPLRFTQPTFNRYEPGMHYGLHVDSAVASGQPFTRRDISVTVFLSDPSSYEGGELVVESQGGAKAVKLPAGEGFAYTTNKLHEVRPVTRGARWAIVLWIQSIIADDEIRALLFDLDASILGLREAGQNGREITLLTRVRQNLERRFATT